MFLISENQMPLDSAVVNVGCTGAVLQMLFGVRNGGGCCRRRLCAVKSQVHGKASMCLLLHVCTKQRPTAQALVVHAESGWFLFSQDPLISNWCLGLV